MATLPMDMVVVGACNMDLISYVPRLPTPGETLLARKFSMGFGGKGANACVMASQLGARTAMVSKLGDDIFGKSYMENFKKHKVNTDHITWSEEESTGVAPIAVDEQGENSIIIASGANLLLSDSDVQKAEAMICQARVVVCALEIPLAPAVCALRLAHNSGVTTIFNAAPMTDLTPDVFGLCSIFCVNEVEAGDVTGLQVKSIDEGKTAAKLLKNKGCNSVVITMGAGGAVVLDGDVYHIPDVYHVATSEVTATDSTGAGDAFVGSHAFYVATMPTLTLHEKVRRVAENMPMAGAGDAFVGSLAFYVATMPNLTLHEKVRRAAEIATISVTKPGTQSSYPTRVQLPDSMFHCS